MPHRESESGDPDRAPSSADTLLDQLGAATWTFDPAADVFLHLSDGAAAIAAIPLERCLAPGFWAAIVHADDRDAAVESRRQAVAERRPHVLEYRLVDGQGRVSWVRDAATVLDEGGVVVVRGAWLDVSRERRAERALRRTQEDLAQVQRLARVRRFAHDLATGELSFSPPLRFDGDLSATPTFASFLERVHHEDVQALEAHLARVFASDAEEFTVTYRFVLPGGVLRHLETTGRVLRDDAGRALRIFGTIQDVTSHYAAEEARLAQVRFLESLDAVNRAIQSASDPEHLQHAVLDALLSAFDADRAWLATRQDGEWRLMATACRPEFPGALKGHVIDGLEALYRLATEAGGPMRAGEGGDVPVPSATRDRFGVRAVVGVALTPPGHGPYVLALHYCRAGHAWSTVEERLLEEVGRRLSDALTVSLTHQALQRSERRLAEAQHLTRLGYWERDFASDHFLMSTEAFDILGIPDSARTLTPAALERLSRERVHPDDRAAVSRASAASIASATPFVMEYRIVHPDGEVRHVRSLSRPSGGPSQSSTRWFGTIQDITDQRRAERAARENLALLRAVFDGTTDGISVKNLEGRFLMVNRALADLRDTTVDDLVGTRDVHDGRESLSSAELAVLTTGEPHASELTTVVAGAQRTLHVVTFPYHDASGAPIGLVSVSRDTTERRHLEQELRQAQKMDAIGRLAGGIAHNFNNILTVILGYAEAIAVGLPAGDPNHEAVEQIVKGAERAAAVTHQLLTFSRTQPVRPRVVDVAAALATLHALLRPIVAEDIDVTVHVEDDLGAVVMDPTEFEQAITNLVVNASDAMPGGGRLRIEAVNATVEADDAPGLLAPGAYVEVRVWDSGRGMDEATRGRIFEPFFTTKPAEAGTGTGLGLSMVYGFVTQLGGHVDVTTRPGSGSLFRLLLPRSAAPAPVAAHRREAEPASGHETILLVEDEESVRRVARLVLESRGYRVVEAHDGVQALAVAAGHQGRIDLLLTDLVMPRMNGRQLAEQLVLADPGLRVLLMSGYPDRVVPSGAATDPRFEFLSKPFQPATLARRVRECLDRGGAAAAAR